MVLLAQALVRIACSRDAAFAYAANLEHFPAWFPGVDRMVSANDLAFDAVGKTYVETVAMPLGRRRLVPLKVVEAEPGSRIVTQGQFPVIRPRMEMNFRALDAAHCEVEWRMFSRSSHLIVHWVLLPLARRLMMRRAQEGLQALRWRLEQERAAPDG